MSAENLYLRGSIWWVRYYEGGRMVRRSLHTTNKREARRLRDQIRGKSSAAKIARDTFGIETVEGAGPVPTFAEVADRFLVHLEASGGLRPNSLQGVRGKLQTWAIPELGKLPISAITTEHIEAFVGKLRRASSRGRGRKGKLGRTQIAFIFRTTQRVFRFALRRRIYSGANPCDLETKPQANGPRTDHLTPDQIDRLLPKLAGWWVQDAALLAVCTGLRWGEVNGLAWDDIDLASDEPTIRVERSFHGPAKNDAAEARTKIGDQAAALLRLLRADARTEYVFPSRLGVPRRRFSGLDRERLAKAGAAAGIPVRLTPHLFRHTFGTLLYEATKDPKMVQRLMRHARIETTLRVYVHTSDEGQQDAANKLPQFGVGRRLRAV